MILFFVLVGFITGAIGAGVALYAGSSWQLALLAYSFTGALGVVIAALVVAFAPTIPPSRGKVKKEKSNALDDKRLSRVQQ